MSTDRVTQLAYRVRVLPGQLERARARVRQLEKEAARYKMDHLLTDPEAVDVHWELEAARSRLIGERKL